jgi:hypothetical protein
MILIRGIFGVWNLQNKINSFFTRLKKFPPFVMFFSQECLQQDWMQRAWRRMTDDDASVSTELYCHFPPFYWGEKNLNLL